MSHTELSPLDITLSSYNRQIKNAQDLEQLLDFETTGGSRLTHVQAEAIINGFKTALYRYLNGTGHVQGTDSKFVTVEEFHLHSQDTLLRAKMTLRQLTDSWLLPVGDKSKSKITVSPYFFSKS